MGKRKSRGTKLTNIWFYGSHFIPGFEKRKVSYHSSRVHEAYPNDLSRIDSKASTAATHSHFFEIQPLHARGIDSSQSPRTGAGGPRDI